MKPVEFRLDAAAEEASHVFGPKPSSSHQFVIRRGWVVIADSDRHKRPQLPLIDEHASCEFPESLGKAIGIDRTLRSEESI